MKSSCIKSYPFTGCSFEKIKQIGDRVGFLYFSDGSFDVYFGDAVVDEQIKGILCYFRFLAEQIDTFNNVSNKGSYSVNTYLDTILLCINEYVSLCKKNNLSFNKDDILFNLNQFSREFSDYRYLSGVVDLLMNDSYYVDVYGTNSCVIYNELEKGNLNDGVSYILDNEYGFNYGKPKCKKLSINEKINACI